VLSILAAFGFDRVSVPAMPRVALVSTGAELLASGERPSPGKIFESNSAALTAVLQTWGCEVTNLRLGDDPRKGSLALKGALGAHEVLITIGGISVGDFDWVHQAVSQMDFETHFRGVAIKPGKPVALGTRSDGKVWFGLPGNPLSAIVTFSLFVARFMGEDHPWVDGRISRPWECSGDREEFVPADLSDSVQPRRVVGSHAILGALGTTGLARIDGSRKAGDAVLYTPWPWGSR